MKIIAVANQKGGVGKTTTSVNLAACLAVRGVRVLLIDLDPQANATSALGLEPIDNHSIYGPILGLEEVSKIVIPTRFKHLWLIPGDLNLAGAEVDVVLLDCPPSLGILMTNALAAADELLVPIQCEYFALEGLSKIVHVIEQIRASGANPGLRIGGILMTMFMRNNLAQQVVNEVQTHFGDVIFKTVVPRTVRLSEAPSHGKTIIEYEPSGLGSTAYNTLADELLARGVVATTNPAAA
jgi:chromosome partitioning protein